MRLPNDPRWLPRRFFRGLGTVIVLVGALLMLPGYLVAYLGGRLENV